MYDSVPSHSFPGLEHLPAALQQDRLLRVGEGDAQAQPERVNHTGEHGDQQPGTLQHPGPLLLEDPDPINISVPITLTLDPLRPFGGYSRNITHLYATVLVGQVGLAGEFTCVFSPYFLHMLQGLCALILFTLSYRAA